MMRRPHPAILVLGIVFSASFTWGQNLVSNHGFDTDVADWTVIVEATIAWSALDAAGSPTSGSALVTNVSTTANDSAGAHQCIEGLTENAIYHLAVDVMIPGGQSETGRVHLLVQWYDAPGCGGVQVGAMVTPGVFTTSPDVWITDSDTMQAPAATQSGRLRLSVWKNEDFGTLEGHFDNVRLIPLEIFADGFESGDATFWSSTVP